MFCTKKPNSGISLKDTKRVERLDNESHIATKKRFSQRKYACLQRESNTHLKVLINFAIISFLAFSIALTQHFISEKCQFSSQNHLAYEVQQVSSLYQFAFISLIILKILLVMSVLMQSLLNYEIVIASWLTKKCIMNFTILKELDLSISGMMVLVNWWENIAQLIVSAAITIFHAIYLQEYTNRRDPLYASSHISLILFRFYLLLSYLINAVFLNIGNSTYFGCYSVISFSLLFVWYIKHGHQIYFDKKSKVTFFILILLLLTVYTTVIQSCLLNKDLISFNQAAKFTFTFIVLSFFIRIRLRVTFEGIANQSQDEAGRVKNMDLKIQRLIQQSISDKDSQSLLRGILYSYFEINNNVPLDYLINGRIYDSILKESFAHSNILKQQQTALRIYLMSLYKQSLKQNKDPEHLLDYCQFLINQFDNAHDVLYYIKSANELPLNILQRVKVFSMELLIKQNNSKFNQHLYDGKLEIEHILEAEDNFSKIKSKVQQYIFSSLNLWNSMQKQEIYNNQIRKTMMRVLKYIDEMNILWKKISKFFKFNKYWRFVYINYVSFILNQNNRQKQLDFFIDLREQDTKFKNQSIYFEEYTPLNRMNNYDVLFDSNSCCFTSIYEQDDLFIQDVSSKFISMLGYSKEEIFNAPMSVIMPYQIVDSHRCQITEWIKSGYLSNQLSYNPKFTSFITKQKEQIPALKYYKVYYNIQKGLQFICLLKANLKQKNTNQLSQKTLQKSQCMKTEDDFIKQQKGIIENGNIKMQIEKSVFFKEEALHPKNTISEISYIKLIVCLFTISIIGCIISLAGLNTLLCSTLVNYNSQFITFMNVYRFPIVLGTNYMKQFLNIGNMAKVNATIVSATSLFLENSNNNTIKETLFDESLNIPDTYYSYDNNNSINFASNLSHIDLFYSIVSSISTLSLTSVNRTSQQYKLFSSYLKPSYENMMNKTKNQLFNKFGVHITKAISGQLTFVISQVCLSIIFFLITFKLISSFLNKMNNITHSLYNFHHDDLRKIYCYWNKVNGYFKNMFHQSNKNNHFFTQIKTKDQTNSQKRQLQKTNQLASMNKQFKDIKQDVQSQKLKTKIRVILLIFMLSIIIITISCQVSWMNTLYDLQNFKNDGYFFLKYFPIAPIVANGCLEKYYSDQFPSEKPFNPQKYEDSLSTMFIYGHYSNYFGQVPDTTSLYYIKQKNYFFGNPCEYNPSIVQAAGITVQKCTTICNGAFKQGMSSYLRYGQQLGDSCINNKSSISKAQLDQLTLAGTILSAYVIDAIRTWTSQFQRKIENMQKRNVIYCLVIIASILLIHFLLSEHRLITLIEIQYEFGRNIYMYFVPNFILSNDKIIRQTFINEGMIIN